MFLRVYCNAHDSEYQEDLAASVFVYKWYTCAKLKGVTSQKKVTFLVATVRVTNLAHIPDDKKALSPYYMQGKYEMAGETVQPLHLTITAEVTWKLF